MQFVDVHCTHAAEEVLPARECGVLEGHAVHAVALVILYVPGGHSTPLGEVDPVGQYVPGVAQGPEHSGDDRAEALPKRPAGHTRQK